MERVNVSPWLTIRTVSVDKSVAMSGKLNHTSITNAA